MDSVNDDKDIFYNNSVVWNMTVFNMAFAISNQKVSHGCLSKLSNWQIIAIFNSYTYIPICHYV